MNQVEEQVEEVSDDKAERQAIADEAAQAEQA